MSTRIIRESTRTDSDSTLASRLAPPHDCVDRTRLHVPALYGSPWQKCSAESARGFFVGSRRTAPDEARSCVEAVRRCRREKVSRAARMTLASGCEAPAFAWSR